MDIKESIIRAPSGDSAQAFGESTAEESKEYVTLCEDLEKLLETGYAELIRTGSYGKDSDDEVNSNEVVEESPFPKGMAVFDKDDVNDEGDLDGSSPFSNEEDGYEVICSREVIHIPAFHAQEQPKTVIG
jgi:hypothetical protein